jgi:starch phosphorylase
VFDRFLGHGWLNRLGDPRTERDLFAIPDQVFWSTHQQRKTELLKLVQKRVRAQYLRNGGSELHVDRMLRFLRADDPNVLTIGFGRRFATYKRATLLFNELDEIRRIVADAARPVVFVFAGKAHPADEPGQDLIRAISRIAREPAFEGRVVLVEDYDMRFARHLVTGVDVWLNNPVYPLEASGTSGMKAGINGVINLSILDGWWGEGYDGANGWAIKPDTQSQDPFRRDREDARTLHEALRESVVPLYYARAASGLPGEWIEMAKRSMASILPRFSAERMLREYVLRSYVPGARQGRVYGEQGGAAATEVAMWKGRVRAAWPGVAITRLDTPARRLRFGDATTIEVAVALNGLAPSDVAVELLLRRGRAPQSVREERHSFAADARLDDGRQRYTLRLRPDLCGRLDYTIRAYPSHARLSHPLEMGLMRWI